MQGEDPTDAADAPEADLPGTLALARANGLSYAFLDRLRAAGLSAGQGGDRLWTEELEARSRYERTLDALRDLTKRHGIDYAIIKNIRTVAHVPRDVDVFVRDADLRSFLEGLKDGGFRILHDNPAEISAQREGALRVDVYPRIHYLGKDFLDEDALAAARTTEPLAGHAMPTLRADVAFALDSIHSILGHGALTLLDWLELRTLASRLGGTGPARVHAAAFGWARAFDLWTSRLDGLTAQVVGTGSPPSFPLRHDRRFVGRFVSLLDGSPVRWKTRAALRLSMFWDDLLFASEGAGLQDGVRRSAVASTFANAAGHRIRTMRGDRKRSGGNG